MKRMTLLLSASRRVARLASLALLAVIAGISTASAGLLGVDFVPGTLYDVDPATGALYPHHHPH